MSRSSYAVTGIDCKTVRQFEDVMSLAGGKGRWQLMFFFWMLLIITTMGYNTMSMAFMEETPEFLCADGHHENATFASLSEGGAERCRAPDGQPCRRWVYDPEFTGSSVVTQWDLVCERLPLLSTVQSMLQFGGLVGSLAAGFFADKVGRGPVQHVTMAVYIVGALLSALPYSYELMLVARFIMGVGLSGNLSNCSVMLIEFVAMEWRVWTGQLLTAPLPLGEILLVAVAYKLRVWWHLQLALAAPMLIFVLNFWLTLESPRWLFVQGRDAEVVQVLATIARVNGRELPEEPQMKKLLEDVRRHELADGDTATEGSQLWRSLLLRRWMLVTCFCWATFNASYYGLSFDVTQLSKSHYLAGLLSGLVGLPGSFLAPLVNRFGRRPITCISYILAGTCTLLVLINDDATLLLVAGLAGKFFISAAQSVLNFYTPEYLPTSTRAIGFGLAEVSSRVGAMVSPYIVDLAGQLHHKAPSMTFGVWSLLAGLATLLLPETTGRQLPETVAQVEAGILDRPESDLTAPTQPGSKKIVDKSGDVC